MCELDFRKFCLYFWGEIIFTITGDFMKHLSIKNRWASILRV